MERPNWVRGRGSAHNLTNRFERLEYDDFADDLAIPGRPRTEFFVDRSRTALASNDSPDVGFSRSVNPYRGCEHGCAYCYARPTHEYLGLSAGLDFESKIMVKPDVPRLLRKELAADRWKPQPVGLSGVTDPYQPIERKMQLTRQCLEVLEDFRNPAVIITKNRLVARDIDILQKMAAKSCVSVFVSVTTLDLELNRVLEPRTSSPEQRLKTIEQLSDAGIPVGTLVAPIIPGLTDHEIPKIIEAVTQAGARYAGKIILRLPLAVAPLFQHWLDEHYPLRKEKILNRLRSMRGGALYDARYGSRMRGEGPFADQIEALFKVACQKYGIAGAHAPLSTEHFRRPVSKGCQMPLFDAGGKCASPCER